MKKEPRTTEKRELKANSAEGLKNMMDSAEDKINDTKFRKCVKMGNLKRDGITRKHKNYKRWLQMHKNLFNINSRQREQRIWRKNSHKKKKNNIKDFHTIHTKPVHY